MWDQSKGLIIIIFGWHTVYIFFYKEFKGKKKEKTSF